MCGEDQELNQIQGQMALECWCSVSILGYGWSVMAALPPVRLCCVTQPESTISWVKQLSSKRV